MKVALGTSLRPVQLSNIAHKHRKREYSLWTVSFLSSKLSCLGRGLLNIRASKEAEITLGSQQRLQWGPVSTGGAKPPLLEGQWNVRKGDYGNTAWKILPSVSSSNVSVFTCVNLMRSTAQGKEERWNAVETDRYLQSHWSSIDLDSIRIKIHCTVTTCFSFFKIYCCFLTISMYLIIVVSRLPNNISL